MSNDKLALLPAIARQYSVTDATVELWRATVAVGCSDEEIAQLIALSMRTGLDPSVKQIYMIKRPVNRGGKWIEVAAPQTSIDGFRLIAERTGKYAGQLGPFWCGKDGVWNDVWLDGTPPAAAKVGVIRPDFQEPLWAVAKYSTYVQKTRDGKVTSFWARMPEVMLAKCAESMALRRAFPQELSGLYTSEEMGQADADAVEGTYKVITQEPQVYAAPKPEKTPDERAAEETYHQNKRDAARQAERGKPQPASPFQRQKLIEEYQRAYGIDKQIAQLETAHIDTYALAKNVLEEVENYSIAPEVPMLLEQYRFITGWYTKNYVNEEVTGSLHHVLHNVADQAGFQWPAIPQDYAAEWVDFLKAETANYNAGQAAAAHVGPN